MPLTRRDFDDMAGQFFTTVGSLSVEGSILAVRPIFNNDFCEVAAMVMRALRSDCTLRLVGNETRLVRI